MSDEIILAEKVVNQALVHLILHPEHLSYHDRDADEYSPCLQLVRRSLQHAAIYEEWRTTYRDEEREKQGYLDVMKLLIGAGADPNAKDKIGWTPLRWAACKDLLDIVQILRAAVAKEDNDHEEIREVDRQLFDAVEVGDVERVEKAIKDGANPNANNYWKDWTPLHVAARKGDLDVVRILLEYKANPNEKDDDGNTPLHWASYYGRLDVMKLLIGAGANLNAQDNDGNTPLDDATSNDYFDIAEVLRAAGAKEDNDHE